MDYRVQWHRKNVSIVQHMRSNCVMHCKSSPCWKEYFPIVSHLYRENKLLVRKHIK